MGLCTFNKVFGVGLSKTGTATLASAMNRLGIKSIHCPRDEITCRELRSGNYNLTILNDYQGATDVPIAAFFDQYDMIYPNSKFILTVRDKESWLDSTSKWFDRLGRQYGHDHYYAFLGYVMYGLHGFNKERFSFVYDCHLEKVEKYFGDKLLIMNICEGDGWDKLCRFLDLPQPNETFPHKNKRRKTCRMFL